MVTMKDIAREAGVSAMTVSNALRGRDNVAPATAHRVLDAAERLGYRLTTTSMSARSLRVRGCGGDSSGVIGVAVFEFDSAQPSQMAAGISRAAMERGYRTIFQQTRVNEQYERDIIRGIANQFCDGLIFSATCLEPSEVDRLAQHRPTVLLDDGRGQGALDTVLSPGITGARAAVSYLLKQGRRHIAVVGDSLQMLDDPERRQSVGGRRLQGCIQALHEAGLRTTDAAFLSCDWNGSAARALVHAMGDHMREYDAIFCLTDGMALGVLRGLTDCGVRVPDDVAVMGFDGIAAGELSVPSLSTVAVDYDWMARIAVNRVIERLEHPMESSVCLCMETPFHLELRESA